MIVKNEAHVIRRCLDSVKSIIDYWVIIDTGSTDGTQEIIRNHLKNIPGELHERPWKNFGENRGEALELANEKGDYLLFMDADDYLEYEDGFSLPALTQDAYFILRKKKDQSAWAMPHLVNATLPWKWEGAVHEFIYIPGQKAKKVILDKVAYICSDDGASHKDPRKLQKYVELLEDSYKKDPTSTRNVFYLAQTYQAVGEFGKALEFYQKRATMGGWEEEVFWAYLQIASLFYEMHLPINMIIEAYESAHNFRPHRKEPLYYLAQIHLQRSEPQKAYEILKEAMKLPATTDMHFTMPYVEEWGLLVEMTNAANQMEKYVEVLEICERLLRMPNLPAAERRAVEQNRAFALEIKDRSECSSLH